MSIKKLLFIFFIIFTSFTFANEIYFIDNEHIQRYKGKSGKWVEVATLKQLKMYSEQFGASTDEVYTINGINEKNFKKSYIFIPYSDSYIQTLMEKGITLQPVTISYNEFIWPIGDPEKITSGLGRRWGRFHPGVDIPAPKGTLVRAAMEGKVIYAGYCGNYGNSITLEHRDNYITRYAHNSVLLVKIGDYVQKGQVIALVGSTGRSTGNHLHFEIRCADIPLNPLDLLPEKTLIIMKNPK
ncbi:MAG: M23 family metallopeptidase [Spirochaetes bacterium]|nr:M23 family metallopeptidase [Spirochaetota bacterium]